MNTTSKTFVRTFAALSLVPLAALSMYGFGTSVTVIVDEDVHEVRTTSETVSDVLEELDIELASNDVVLPRLEEPLNGEPIVVERAITVTVETSEGSTLVNAPVRTVDGALTEAGFGNIRNENVIVFPHLGSDLQDGETIIVTFPTEIAVNADGKTLTIETYGEDVAAALLAAQVEIGEDDIVLPELSTPVENAESVTVQRVTFETETVTVAVPFEETRRETNDLERGFTRVQQEGKEGVETQTWLLTFVDGEQTEREQVETEITTEPQDRVVLVGTRAPAPPPAPTPAPSTSSRPNQPNSAPPASDPIWDRLAQCESGGNWSINTGNGYYGGLQFLPSTWRSVGGTGLPHQHSRAEQIYRAQILQERSGWGQWPACTRRLGLR